MMWWDIVGCTNPFTTFRVKIKHDFQKLGWDILNTN